MYQSVGLSRDFGLSEESVLEEVLHRQGYLLLLLGFLLLRLGVLLLGLDLNEPLTGKLFARFSADTCLLGLGLFRFGVELGQAFAFGPLALRSLGLQGVLLGTPAADSARVARTACHALIATPATSSRAIAAAVVNAARFFRANFRNR